MIEFRNLQKTFGERAVLRGLNLKISEGEIVFLLGRSGTGKSVSLKLIVGLLKATSGEIWLSGENITHFSEEQFFEVRKKCGMVFQHPALFDSMTVFENVAYGLRQRGGYSEEQIALEVRKYLNLVHLKNVEDKLPQQISYGSQKRASLARTMANQPRILLFDEPTTGLDPITTNAINSLIKELSSALKVTSVVVSHDMKCALDIADRIIVMDEGQIIGEGTPSEIKKSQHPIISGFMREVQ